MKPSGSKNLEFQGFTVERVIEEIRGLGNPENLPGIARYGIRTDKAYGVSIPKIRNLAKKIGKQHDLAEQLWKTGIHEARILAGMIDDPTKVTEAQMERWAGDFDSWDVVDGACGNLLDRTRFAVSKAYDWSTRNEEYVKRAGFVLMAELAVHDKKAADKVFLDFLPVIVRESTDDRNFVRKAVNWSLRQIGKRNTALNKAAVRTAETIQKIDSKAARWIAADALRELTSDAVQEKLRMMQRTRE